MNELIELFQRGGLVMIAIVSLSVILYSRCFKLLLSVRRSRRSVHQFGRIERHQLPAVRLLRDEAQDAYHRQRAALGAMIAAAPLLGLLGTVSGMEKTFESLAGRAGDKSMEGLARGISEVLVATESGLAVALPALLLVYIAHRQVHKHVEKLNRLERSLEKGAAR